MAKILELYHAVVGVTGAQSHYFFLQAPNSYGGSLDTICGVNKATDVEQDNPAIAVSQLLQKGILFRVNVQYAVAGIRRSGRLLVTRPKLVTALDELIDETYRGGIITSARIPTKATFF